ncbi:MAG: hypothetical protein AMXMBFR64_30700 [Myxococcales bacterium]
MSINWVRWVLIAALATACDSSNDSGELSEAQKAVEAFTKAALKQGESAQAAHQAALDAIRVASDDFTVDLTTADPSADAAVAVTAALGLAGTDAARWVGTAFDMNLASGPLMDGTIQAHLLGGPLGAPRTPDAELGQQRGPLLFTALAVGSLLLTAYGAYKGAKSAVDSRAEPVNAKIGAATPQELEVINTTLSLPANTPKEQTQAHFNNLGMGGKLTAAKAVEQDLRLAETDGAPGVSDVDATAINQSVKNGAVKLGETAVKTTVSAVTTATGGQGYTEALQTVGLTKSAAALTDFGITAVSTVSGQSLQPLDILADHLDVVVISKETTPITVPPPSPLSVDDARALMDSPTATAADQDAAADTLAHDAIVRSGTALAPVTNEDGSVTVQVPVRTHITRVDDPTNHLTVKIPQLGKADVLILVDGKVPQAIEGVDTDTAPNVSYDGEDLTVWSPDAQGAFALLVIATPADPGPSEAVLVTGTITPPTAGVRITLAVTGTDGYSNEVDTQTDESGSATLSIPGGAEGVVDTVTVTLPDNGVSKTLTYAF